MHHKVTATVVGAVLFTFCSGATCRQETAQRVLATFLNTVAETAAQELVRNTAKPRVHAGDIYSATEAEG